MKMIKGIVAAAAIAATTLLAGCGTTGFAKFQTAFSADAAAIEAKVAAFVASWKKNAPVVLADAQTALALSCNLITLGNSGLQTFQSQVGGLSDKAETDLAMAQALLNKGSAGCAAYNSTQSAAPTPSATANTALGVWNAYIAAKAQISAAQAAATVTAVK